MLLEAKLLEQLLGRRVVVTDLRDELSYTLRLISYFSGNGGLFYTTGCKN